MEKKASWRQSLWETFKFIVITLLIVVPIRSYVAQPFVVSGLSMAPSFDDGEYLIVDELTYLLREPKRGEIIVFRYPKDPSKFFIKRVVGLPGETVQFENNHLLIEQDGEKFVLETPPGVKQHLTDSVYPLAENEYFVLGDNRDMSLDSRAWGPVPENLIKGRVFLRLFPLNRVAFLPATD